MALVWTPTRMRIGTASSPEGILFQGDGNNGSCILLGHARRLMSGWSFFHVTFLCGHTQRHEVSGAGGRLFDGVGRSPSFIFRFLAMGCPPSHHHPILSVLGRFSHSVGR